jgi:hypothetical protein
VYDGRAAGSVPDDRIAQHPAVEVSEWAFNAEPVANLPCDVRRALESRLPPLH